MSEPLATPADVRDRWPAVDAEDRLLSVRVAEASALLRALVPDVDDRLADGRVEPLLVVGAVADAVGRFLRNPDRLRSFTTTTGPYSEGGTFDGAVGLFIDPGDVERIGADPVGVAPSRRGLRQVRLGSPFL